MSRRLAVVLCLFMTSCNPTACVLSDDEGDALPPNGLPTALAGANQTVTGGSTVTLDGSGSSDPLGDPLAFGWSQIAGTTVTLSNAAAAQPTFTAPATFDVLAFELTVDDGRGAIDTDTVLVTQGSSAQNRPPRANAGGHRDVLTSSTVTLYGFGFDPDGDALTYAWVQTGGTGVTLSSATAAMPTFTAPAAAGALSFDITTDDGNGGADTDSVTFQVVSTLPPPILYVVNAGAEGVVAFASPATVDGNVAPDTHLMGVFTGFGTTTGETVVDAPRALLVGDSETMIRSWNAGNLTGNAVPDRIITGAATVLGTPLELFIDAPADHLLAFNGDAGAIVLFDGVSDPGFDGAVPPARAFFTASASNIDPGGMTLSPSGELYLADRTSKAIFAYPGATALSGDVLPSRVITSAFFEDLSDVLVDDADRLYVLDQGVGVILVFDNASTLTGSVIPSRAIVVNASPVALVIDAAGTGYLVNDAIDAVYQYDNIATLNGTPQPDRIIQGANTGLSGPRALHLAR